jgi:uncharacterized membrane protein
MPQSHLPQTHLKEHIDLIARHEQDFLAQRTRSERVGDAIAGFVGNLKFVVGHLVLFAVWILFNSLRATLPQHFDPVPYSLLSTIVTLEAILLASFILMRQGRMGRRAEERDHLMLQILLLTEKELTAVIGIERQIAREAGLDNLADRPDIKEFSNHTSIDDVARTIKENLPPTE